MADDIRVDKIVLRESVKNSIDRLMSQNYIGRSGDTYNFLTDEEQDIQREIKATNIDTASIVEKISNTVFRDIYGTPITKNVDSDADVLSILNGNEITIEGTESNGDAIAKVEEYLEMQKMKLLKDFLREYFDIMKKKDDLLDSKDDLQDVESFFKNQVAVFDAAVQKKLDLRDDLDYLSKEEDANKALKQIRLIAMLQTGKFNYKRIPELNGLMEAVRTGHDCLLAAKREELLEIVRQCMEAVHTAGDGSVDVKSIIAVADTFYS